MAEEMNELTRQCLDLTKKNRKRLIKILEDSLIEKEDDGGRFHILLSIAEDIVGKGILSRFRDLNLVIGRRMIAYQMRQEGYSLMAIGKKLIRHHSSVMHMIRMMEDAIKFQFRPELTYWEEFQQKLQEYEKEISSQMV
jgi:chromosomal replication initiation ATPase DnaA